MSMRLVAVSMVVLLALAGVAEARGSGRGGGKSGGVALRAKGIVGSVPLAFTRSVPATPGLVSPLLRPSTAGAIVVPRALTTGIVPPARVRNASRVVAFTDSGAVVSSTRVNQGITGMNTGRVVVFGSDDGSNSLLSPTSRAKIVAFDGS